MVTLTNAQARSLAAMLTKIEYDRADMYNVDENVLRVVLVDNNYKMTIDVDKYGGGGLVSKEPV